MGLKFKAVKVPLKIGPLHWPFTTQKIAQSSTLYSVGCARWSLSFFTTTRPLYCVWCNECPSATTGRRRPGRQVAGHNHNRQPHQGHGFNKREKSICRSFAGALPKETHCSCRNKRNNRGIILPPKKCVYAEYCSKKNIGSLPDAKNLRYHMEVICHCRYFSINQAFTCDLKKGFSCVIHKELRRIETLRVEFCKNRLWYLKSDNEDDSDDFDFTPKPIQTRSITFTVEPGLCRTAHSQRTAETLDQILAKLKGWREKKRCKKNLKMCDFPLCREDLKCDRTEPCYSRTS